MGAGASSGAGPAGSASSAVRFPAGASSVTASDKMGMNVNMGPSSISDHASRANTGSVDHASPKQAKHVVIQAAEPKPNAPKGQKGGLMEKLRQIASQNNSPSHSAAPSRMASRTASQAGSHIASEKSQMSTRISRRDDYDVDSDDEDLEGFIYDDESTSEDEREDYVNAFSRKKKLPRGDDYSDYEGAAVRALTAGRKAPKSAAMRRSRSNTDDEDGDDEWDPEEEKIRVLRQQKRQQDRARAASVAPKTATAGAAGAGQTRGGQAGPGPSTAAAAGKGQDTFSGQQQQSRMTPQPPAEPPTRGISAVRRNAVAAGTVASSNNNGGGGLSGPSPGSGHGLGLGPGPAGRSSGSCTAVPAPPPPQVNYGASASSQYWQAKRTQYDEPGGNSGGGEGMSRLEQLMALQKKKLAQQEQGRGDNGGHSGGVRWQVQTEPPRAASQQKVVQVQDCRVRSEQGAQKSELQPPEPNGQQTRSSQREWQEEPTGYRESIVPNEQQPLVPQRPPSPPYTQQEQQQEQQQRREEPQQHKNLEGHSFIKHLAPPSSLSVQRVRSGRVRSGRGAATAAPPSIPRAPAERPADVTDFDVDEMLNSFAATGADAQQQEQQWAGGRPQPPPSTPPSENFSPGAAPQHKRSIRNVKSDFTSMRVNDMADGATDLTARMLSLPLAAARPLQNGAGGGTSGQVAPAAAATAPPTSVAVSRFARMGANMLGPSSSSDGSAVSAPAAAWGGSNGGVYRGPAAAPSSTATQLPSPLGGNLIGGSPVRRPRRSNQSSDGGVSPMHTSLSAPAGDGSNSGASSGGGAGGPVARPSLLASVNSPRLSGAGVGDTSLVLPAIRPCSGGPRASEGGSILNGSPGLSVLGRSRFGNAQHQQFKQEAVRSSAPVLPTQRDYDSDSALTRAGGPARSSWNGGNSAAVGGALVSGPGYGSGVGPGMGMGPVGVGPGTRSRLAQVGA